MEKVTQISLEELAETVRLRTIAVDKAAEAQKSALEANRILQDAQLAEANFISALKDVYIDHCLSKQCKIDITNGVVTWPEDTQVQEPVVAAPVEVVEAAPKKKAKKVTK